MWQQTQLAPATAELFDDAHLLLGQIGSPDGLVSLAGLNGPLAVRQISSPADLRMFLQNYHAQILQPLELPAIQHAFNHAGRNELRELIAFDRQIAAEPLLQSFASASRLIGLGRLKRVRPMRDQRLARRYLDAVEKGEANGWHTLVYGLTLAIYSLPLRPGLLGYAQQTTRGFIQSRAHSLKLSDAEAQRLLAELSAPFPAAVESLLAPAALQS